jgi:Rps23 Pro-64 3,4-dihydroxylase Tpa1-like proline 4-hydroxylase
MPFNLPLDSVSKVCDQLGKENPEIIKEYEDVTYRSYIYPRGCKLSWHDDSTTYCGAMTFYTHPKWGSTWGGELIVAEVPPPEKVFKHSPCKPHISHEWEDDYINLYGIGQFINPKPNRMVLMAPGVYHSINRVDPDAGDHPRCSIVGFFLKEKGK